MAQTVVVVLVVAAVLVLAATRPATFRIELSIAVAAPPERVFPLVADFRAWRDWSPWEGLDPALKRSYSGAAGGLGAVYGWEGDRKVGAGRMEVVAERPPSDLTLKLDFMRPFEAHNTVDFHFVEENAGTRVVWAMQGANGFVSKLMQLFFSMDRMVGKDFEKGLASLKALAERGR